MVRPVPPRKPTVEPIIKPTEKPTPADMVKVSTNIVQQVQGCVLSPSAVVAALSCALELYAGNITEAGFDPDVTEQCKTLGKDLAKQIRKSGLVKTKTTVLPNDEIITPSDMPLVGADGSPLTTD